MMRRVTDKEDVVFIGDSSGRILQMEGTGLQDGGSSDIVVDRTSGTIRLPTGRIFDIKGNVKYRKLSGATLTLTFLFGGKTVFDVSKTITIVAPTNTPVFGGAFYFGGEFYFGVPFADRIYLQDFGVEGASTHVEVKASVTGAEVEISEIEIEISAVA